MSHELHDGYRCGPCAAVHGPGVFRVVDDADTATAVAPPIDGFDGTRWHSHWCECCGRIYICVADRWESLANLSLMAMALEEENE